MDIPAFPRRVYLYEEPSAPTLDLSVVAAHITKVCGIQTSVRGPFLLHHVRGDLAAVARELAAVRIVDVAHPLRPADPPPQLVHFERRQLESPERRASGVLYDGFGVQRIFRENLQSDERTLSFVHVAFTSRLLGTFDEGDRRYHARSVVLGCPSIVSESGLVEGPAKPRAFYAAKRGLRIDSADARYESLKGNFAGQFLDFDDARLTQVAKGYALQAIFYHVTGEPFCEDEDCVLFNAHWQEQMLQAHVESGLLCARHLAVAESLKDGRRSRGR